MQADLERLVDLQQVDLRLLDLTRQIHVFPRYRAEVEQKLVSARNAVTETRESHTHHLTVRKKLELDVQQLEEKISKYKGQLFEVKTNDAYRALQDEIALAEKQKTEAEDHELEAMVGADEFELKIKDAEAALKEAEQKVGAQLKQIDAEQKVREEEAAGLKAQQEKLRAKVGEESLENYDRLAAGLKGIALAEVRDGICQVCATMVRPQTFAEVRRGEKVHTCEICHRIYYFVPVVDVEKEMAKGDKA